MTVQNFETFSCRRRRQRRTRPAVPPPYFSSHAFLMASSTFLSSLSFSFASSFLASPSPFSALAPPESEPDPNGTLKNGRSNILIMPGSKVSAALDTAGLFRRIRSKTRRIQIFMVNSPGFSPDRLLIGKLADRIEAASVNKPARQTPRSVSYYHE